MTESAEATRDSVDKLATLIAQNSGAKSPVSVVIGTETQDVRNVAGTLGTIGNSKVTSEAAYILGADREPMVWQESPSLALMLSPLIGWTIVALAAIFIVYAQAVSVEGKVGPRLTSQETAMLHSPLPAVATASKAKKRTKAEIEADNQAQNERKAAVEQRAALANRQEGWKDFIWYEWARNAVLVYVAYRLLRRLAELKTTRYRMSSQRLIVDRGVLSRVSVPFELHKFGDAVIHQPLLLRLCGVSNVHVSGLRLEGLRNAELVRSLIRSGGQLEAQRTDKIRWR